MDGAAGVTQDAVEPGQRYIYRFRARQAGAYWYHSHQHSAEQVRRGLFGALVVEPRDRDTRVADIPVLVHKWDEVAHPHRPATFDGSDLPQRRQLAAGTSFGFYDGRLVMRFRVNGHLFPDVPTLLVRRGELVKMTIVNSS